MEWEQFHTELANKVRWALGTASNAAGFNMSFRECQGVASLFAGEVLSIAKMNDQNPGVDYALMYKKLTK